MSKDNQNQFFGMLRLLLKENRQSMQDFFSQIVSSAPPSVTEELNAIDGRRMAFALAADGTFTIAQNGQRGNPLLFQVSVDGPFVQTHYPFVIWRPSAPAAATNLGQWMPPTQWPIPDQDIANRDSISISHEIFDAGSQRFMQNQAYGPAFSRPDNLAPLPVPTVWSPNSTIQFFPTFHDILFNTTVGTPTTEGTLHVALLGIRIINM